MERRVPWPVPILMEASRAPWESGSWTGVVERLLRGCVERQQGLQARMAVDADLAATIRDDVRTETRAIAGQLRSSRVHFRIARRLAAVAASHLPRWSNGIETAEVLVAAGMADGIDDALFPMFEESFREKGWLTLEPDCLFPVHHYHPREAGRELIAGPTTSRPELSRLAELDHTPHLRLAPPQPHPLRVTLDYDAYGRLAALGGVDRLVLAACQPNIELDDFDTEFVTSTPEGRGYFRNRGPKRPAEQAATLRAQLQHARDAGAHVVVFPEYTVHESQREALLQRRTTRKPAGQRRFDRHFFRSK